MLRPIFIVRLVTLASASTVAKVVTDRDKLAANVVSAKRIGTLAAEAAKSKGIKQIVFDRSGAKYHGKVKALAVVRAPTSISVDSISPTCSKARDAANVRVVTAAVFATSFPASSEAAVARRKPRDRSQVQTSSIR